MALIKKKMNRNKTHQKITNRNEKAYMFRRARGPKHSKYWKNADRRCRVFRLIDLVHFFDDLT